MNDKIKSVSFTDRIWDFLASVKLSVIVLLTLAFASIIGTLIPQNKPAAQYIQKYGESWHAVFERLNFYDMYSSWWFQFLLALLIMNIVVCSIDRLGATWKVIFPDKPVFRAERFRKSSFRKAMTTGREPRELQKPLGDFMEKHFRHSKVETTDNGYLVYGEKGRWTRLGAYVVHLSILLLTLGVLISSLFGYEGHMNLPVGDTNNIMTLRHSDVRVQLPFELRCDDFSVEHYPDSRRVREYRSELAVLENSEELFRRSLIVNDPIRFRGYSIYQSTYGRIPGETFSLVMTENASGLQVDKQAAIGEVFEVPGGKGTISIQDYVNNFNFRGRNLGPTYLAMLIPESGGPRPIILPVEHSNFDRMRQGEFTFSISNIDYRYFTGLQISRDPGIPIVYLSFIIMIIGFIMTFYMSHRQICIEVQQTADGRNTVTVSGISPNKRPGVNMAVKRVAQRVEQVIKQN